jgi:cytochrome P450
MEAVLLLASIAQRYRVKVIHPEPVEIAPAVTLRPKRGLRVLVERRA